MAHIKVNNFGPISSFDGEVDDFTVIIGRQATGKSTLAKLVYFFKTFPILLATHEWTGDHRRSTVTSFSKLVKHKFIDNFGPFYTDQDFKIEYYFGKEKEQNSDYCKVSQSGNFTDFTFSEELATNIGILVRAMGRDKWAIAEKKSSFVGIVQAQESISLQRGYLEKAKELFSTFQTPLYVPAGRSLFTLLSGYQGQIPFSDRDFVLRDYLALLNKIRPMFGESLEDIEAIARQPINIPGIAEVAALARDLIDKIIHGYFLLVGNEERIYYNDNDYKFSPLKYTSSGQQESIWIALIAYIIILERYPVFAVFEEPESHLYPDGQDYLLRLLSLVFHANSDNSVLITTHSPYILSSINNLIYSESISRNVKEKDKINKLSKIINKKLWLSYDSINAYKFDKKNKSILDDSLKMIQSEEIDTVSSRLNSEYDKLMEFYHE